MKRKFLNEIDEILLKEKKDSLSKEELKLLGYEDDVYIRGVVKEKLEKNKIELTSPTFPQLRDEIIKYYPLDVKLLKTLLAVYVANMYEDETELPVWLLIIAPPSYGKTKAVILLQDLPNTYFISELTPHTFLSGDKNTENSLLFRLPKKAVLIFKDFTTLMELPPEKRSVILAQMREIYDGQYIKEFGSSTTKKWSGKIGIIACATTNWFSFHHSKTIIGERFLFYRIYYSDDEFNSINQQILSRRIDKNVDVHLKGVIKEFISNLKDYSYELNEQEKNYIIKTANFIAKARCAVVRDGYKKEIINIPEPEAPFRIVQQLRLFYSKLQTIDNNIEDNLDVIKKVILSSISEERRKVIEFLLTREEADFQEIRQVVNISDSTLRRTLEDLDVLGVVNKESRGKDYWHLKGEYKEIFVQGKIENPTPIKDFACFSFTHHPPYQMVEKIYEEYSKKGEKAKFLQRFQNYLGVNALEELDKIPIEDLKHFINEMTNFWIKVDLK
ncbi:MAG: hypothetical protein NC922_06880 [Candidatus Omnitrophica bacterium]|nr:hypothetical protein [Candidatus Omnitrophota bacterium]